MVVSIVINDKRKIRHQLEISYSIILFISTALTMAICLALITSLVRTAHDTAEVKITSQTTETLVAVAFEVGSTIIQQFKLISENVVLSSVLMASILIKHSNLKSVNGTLFLPMTAYRDYNFIPGCQAPSCPSDYPPLEYSSPNQEFFPNSFVNGSFSHPSVYVYSRKYQQAVRNDSFWDLVVEESPEIINVVNGLVYQDNDFAINYKPENNLFVANFFYLTAQIENLQTGVTNVVQRTFPGIRIVVNLGDPTKRNWFKHAPIDAVYFGGPYITLTGRPVVSMSSRKVVYFPEGSQEQRITFVSAGMMTLERLAASVNISYTDSGFGAIINTETNEVLVWKSRLYPVYDASSETFYTLSHFDPQIATEIHRLTDQEMQQQRTIRYTDNDGIEWLVAYRPMFTSQRLGEETSYSPLAILVWSKLDESNAAHFVLDKLLDKDTYELWVTDVIVLAMTIGVVMLLVYFLVQYITSPLPKLMALADEMIVMSTASEEDKNFSMILSDPLFSLDRHDEIGLLIADYYQLLTVLQERSLMNRDMSQYPANPFYVSTEVSEKSGTKNQSFHKNILSKAASHATLPIKTEYNWQWFVSKVSDTLSTDQRMSFAESIRPKIARRVSFNNKIVLVKPKSKAKNGSVRKSFHSNNKVAIDAIPEEVDISQRGVVYNIQEKWTESQKVNRAASKDASTDSRAQQQYQEYEQMQNEEEDITQKSMTENHPESLLFTPPESKQTLVTRPSDHLVGGEADPATAFRGAAKKAKTIRSQQTANEVVTIAKSLRTQLAALFALLLLGCIVTMALTAYNIESMGRQWTYVTKRELRAKANENMQSIAVSKAAFATVYFMQLSSDIYCLGQFYRDLASGTILRPNWYSSNNSELYLPSYATERTDPYATGVLGTTNYSAYEVSYADGCEKRPDNCAIAHNSYNTRMTSLMDLKLRSLYRPGNVISYIFTSLEEDSTSRYISYRKTYFRRPIVCLHNDFTLPRCKAEWTNSSCNPKWVNPTNASAKYFPTYDVRCRDWYQAAAAKSNNNSVQYVTQVSQVQGNYVLLGSYAVFENPTTLTNLLGIVRTASTVDGLAAGLSKLNYLQEGYCYMIRGEDTTAVTFHPAAKAGCVTVRCVEGFSAEEYAAFSAAVLVPLQDNQDISHPGSIYTTFTKQGREWQLVYSRVYYRNFNFILIAVLPVDVINETADEIASKINYTLVVLIIALVISLVFLTALSTWYAAVMVSSIVDPINELRKVFELVRMNEDLSGQVPEEASSSDMRVLLTAFSKLMIALRFSNESYAQGNQKRAFNVYTDALSLYTTNNDKRGIGMSLANLAASELARQKYDAAESLYKKSIANAEDILFDTANPLSRAEEIKIERLLSDRKECLAEVYLQCDQLDDAMAVLNPAMELDIQNANLVGYAQKQCAIARYHQREDNLEIAEDTVNELLKFIRNIVALRRQKTVSAQSPTTAKVALIATTRAASVEERESAEQIALFCLARIKKEMGADVTEVESCLLLALTKSRIMHTDSASKILIMLKKMFAAEEDRRPHILQLNWLAQEFNLNVDRDTGDGGFAQIIQNELKPPKRVMLCVDYSAAMAGVSFQAMMDNINTIFELHVNAQDSLSVVYYGEKIGFGLPPTLKKGNELMILECMERLTTPKGDQLSLYDAMMVSLYTLSREPTPHDWLIVVTASEDNASRTSLSKTIDRVMLGLVGLIVIGVGEGVHGAALQLLANSTKRGVYFHAAADTKSINEAFDHAIKIVEMSCTKCKTID